DRLAPRTDIEVDVSSARICACFDMHTAIVQWADSMRPPRPEDGEEGGGSEWVERNIFSPFLYPFLLGSGNGAKAELLWSEAFQGMVRRFESARDRQAQLLWLKEMLGTDTPEWPLLASSGASVGDAINPFFLLDVRRDQLMHDAMDTLLLAGRASAAASGRMR
ncbi:hypothetical protein EV175_007608, partial [Coemansia sp. RSA 1933]